MCVCMCVCVYVYVCVCVCARARVCDRVMRVYVSVVGTCRFWDIHMSMLGSGK